MPFDLVDMRLMVLISDAASLTKAAEASHLSLPAVSNRVKNLEEGMQTQLLFRNSQGVSLTPSGEAFVRHARLVLRQLDHLRGDIREYASGVRGLVRVLANTTAMSEFMPAALTRYLAAHPDVHVELRERLSFHIVRAVADGAADIGVVAGDVPGGRVELLPYRSDRLVLVVPEGHRLAGQEHVAFAETLGEDYVGLSEWSAIHAFLMRAADGLGHLLQFRVEVGSFESVCRLIAARVGIGVVPERTARRLALALPIRLVHLTDPWALRQLHICVRSMQSLPVFARELVEVLVNDAQDDRTAGSAGPAHGAPERIVLASDNPGKLREFSALLAPHGIEVVPQGVYGVQAAPEPHPTFVENALAKARHASRYTGLPAIADDSGLCVDALNGAPGVLSARYAMMADAGEGDADNNALLVRSLAGESNRRAEYVAVLAMVRHVHDPCPLVAQGIWQGKIQDQPRGAHGFGYDPHFFLPDQGQTAAEMQPERKNQLSHRAQALRQLLAQLRERPWS